MAATAYAALVSLMHTIQQIQHHPRPPISLDQNQVDSLKNNLTELQDFLERYYSGGDEADELENRIASAACAAEDVIESHLAYKVLVQPTARAKITSFLNFFRRLWRSQSPEEMFLPVDFHQGLQAGTECLDLVSKEVMKIKEKTRDWDLLHMNPPTSAGSSRSASIGHNSVVVGFDDVLYEIKDKLTGHRPDRQVFPIVGMGGIGKTTLARSTYLNPLMQHFDVRAWVTISQEYNRREALLDILLCLNKTENREKLSRKSENELGEILYKYLFGRRYLIVMDDVWTVEVWEKVRGFFPDIRNGSRIIITTRLESVAFHCTGSPGLKIRFLNEGESWNLLCKTVFGEEECPLELEEIGKKIAGNCKGLPLSIVVIGGLIAKRKQTREHWEHIADSLNSILSSEDDERCFKILHTSYKHLPVHLKPCFLYMGVFPYDHVIRVSSLIKLWVGEGLLKLTDLKSQEEVAEENLKNLIDRNLILVHQRGSNGRIKFCQIHDLVRDLCIREAEKEKFLCVKTPHSYNISDGIEIQRRFVIHESTSAQVLHALRSSCPRSLICDQGVLPPFDPTLLRVLKAADKDTHFRVGYSAININDLVNLRYLAISPDGHFFQFSSSIYLPWNLQTLIVRHKVDIFVPSEIWKMPRLRHVEFSKLHLPDPPSRHMDWQNDLVLGNLHTLSNIVNFKCGEEVVKRIRSIKKLKIFYRQLLGGSRYHLNNLNRLHRLESLSCLFPSLMRLTTRELLQNLTFPHSLKKLTLCGSKLDWEKMTTEIGSLPLLEVLKLRTRACIGPKWETVEGKFCSLQFLLLEGFDDLQYWTTDSTHFPRLESLVLRLLHKLEEVPTEIGDVPTLQSIQLESCSDSVVISAKNILEEQKGLGNEDLQVRVRLQEKNKQLESLASPNFQVEVDKN